MYFLLLPYNIQQCFKVVFYLLLFCCSTHSNYNKINNYSKFQVVFPGLSILFSLFLSPLGSWLHNKHFFLFLFNFLCVVVETGAHTWFLEQTACRNVPHALWWLPLTFPLGPLTKTNRWAKVSLQITNVTIQLAVCLLSTLTLLREWILSIMEAPWLFSSHQIF